MSGRDEPLLEHSEEGAYSFKPGISVSTLRAEISALEFQALQRRLRELRRPLEWRASLLCAIHRDIFGTHFGESAGRFRLGEMNYGRRAAVPPEHIQSLTQQLILSIQDDLRISTESTNFTEELIEHVFLTAARHHAEMIRIHPFVDGNGRWARFVTSLYLNDCGLGCGTIIYARDKERYIKAIDRIHDGNEPGHLADLFLTGYLDQAERRFSGTRPRTP